MNMDKDEKIGWVSDASTEELVEKVKRREKLNRKEVVLPTTTHIGKIISALPQGYLDIFVEGCGKETYNFDTIIPHTRVSEIYLKRSIMMCEDEEDHFERYQIHNDKIIDRCTEKNELSIDDCVEKLNYLYDRVRKLERENFELIKKNRSDLND